VFWICLAAACRPSEPPVTNSPPASGPVVLRLLIAGDPELAKAIGRLKGEWKGRSGDTLEISEMVEQELLSAKSLEADAVIYPSARLGPLAERGLLAAVPKSVLESEELAWTDLFERLQTTETTWGKTVFAVPLGSPVFTCCYRVDQLAKLGRQPPRTWTEYQELAALLNDRRNLGDLAPAEDQPWSGALEPLGPGWSGRMLLARAAAYAKQPDAYSVLFDMDDMRPLITGPAFVQALTELIAAADAGASFTELDPAAVRGELLAGRCAMAITWPTATGEHASAPPNAKFGFVELPGAERVYMSADQKWRPRSGSDRHVTLLATTGRLASVPEDSRHPVSAFRLLTWLSGKQWSSRISPASEAATLFRNSQTVKAQAWVPKAVDAEGAQQYAASVRQALSRTSYVTAPRIPEQDEYLAALDEAVQAAVAGKTDPPIALEQAAARWSEITKRLGIEAQKKAYLHSLGLDP